MSEGGLTQLMPSVTVPYAWTFHHGRIPVITWPNVSAIKERSFK